MKQLYFLLFFLPGGLVLPLPALPQSAPADSAFVQQALVHLSQLYTRETGENLHLYNGSEYLRGGHGVKGFPFFQSDNMLKGDVYYDGHLYTGIGMQYDLAEDELIVNDYTGNVSIRLVKNKVSWFMIDGHRFVHIKAGTGLPAAGFYESLYKGRLGAYARWQKGTSGTGDNMAGYKLYYTWLLENDGTFITVESGRAVLMAAGDKREALEKYIQTNKLNFKKDPAGFLAGTIGYYDQLNH